MSTEKSITSIPKKQVVYIVTSRKDALQNRFKVGGVESEDKLMSRLSTYNRGSTTGDLFYFSDWFLVHNYKEVENRIKDLLGNFKDKKSEDVYVLNYPNLKYILQFLVDVNYSAQADLVNAHLSDFFSLVDATSFCKLCVPKRKCLIKITISFVGKPDVVIEGDTYKEVKKKWEQYLKILSLETKRDTSTTLSDSFLSFIGDKMSRM
jgi:hypothetical protein